MTRANRLAREKSPYLLQHAHNPVDWYSWDEEAFEKSRKENKPIFLSIGYATCHWCHVMERESFENDAIASLMNELFVNIKVDREERPDVDHIYMTAVQAMVGGGGWPLSVFLSPTLEPFFGGTYFPPDNRYGRPGFPTVLKEISRMWKEDNGRVVEWGAKIRKALQETSSPDTVHPLDEEILRRAYTQLEESFDAVDGGFGSAPKFPRSESLSLLLRIHRRTGKTHALAMAQKTLDAMARGGIYDHVGGGFSRYATDSQWLVPHFEKMLYDNALLAKTYLEAYQVDKNPLWASITRETLDYVLRDMTHAEGGFYSAEDADSEGVEGKFYVWSEAELQDLLTAEEFQKVKETYGITAHGNFEHKNIPFLKPGTPWEDKYREPLKTAVRKMGEAREKRVHPLKDDKILASWNGLMISAFCSAGNVLDEARYLEAAQKAGTFVWKRLWNGQALYRRFREGDVRYEASLEDYAFIIQSFIDLYEASFDFLWLERAQTLQSQAHALFWDAQAGGYFSTDGRDPTLIARTKDIYDGAIPSGNSIMALNLLKLHALTENEDYRLAARKIFDFFSAQVLRAPYGSPSLLIALDFATDHSFEIVFSGDKKSESFKDLRKSLAGSFAPNKVLACVSAPSEESRLPLLKHRSPTGEETLVYVCRDRSCLNPVKTPETLAASLASKKEFSLY